MSDLIDRDATIKSICEKECDALKPCQAECESIWAVKEMPSIQPRTGKWTRHFDGNEWYWYCSSCKEQWYEEDLWMGGNSFPNFCPNCGCRMEEGASE